MEHSVVQDGAKACPDDCQAALGPAEEQVALPDPPPAGATRSATHESDASGAAHRAAMEDALRAALAARNAERSAVRELDVQVPDEADLQPEALELCIPAVARSAA